MDSSDKNSCEVFDKSENSSSNDFPTFESNLPSIEPQEEKSCEDLDKSENSSNTIHALESNLPSIEPEENKACEDLDKSEDTTNDFPTLEPNLPSVEAEEEIKSNEDFDKSENGSDDFPALVSKFSSKKFEEEKSIITTTNDNVSNNNSTNQEAPKFSYAAMLSKMTSNSPSTLVRKVVRVAPSTNETCPNGAIKAVTPKEKVVCVRGLSRKVKATELIQALKKFGPVKLDSLHFIKRSEYGNSSATLEFISHDSARAAVEAGKIKFGENDGFVSFKNAPLQYGTRDNSRRERGRGRGY